MAVLVFEGGCGLAGSIGGVSPLAAAAAMGPSTISILRKRFASAVGCPGTSMMSLSLSNTVSGC